jgi:choline dehydrogenase-like flavoprotein
VVNEWGRGHDVKNLFIVDGSIWVTSGGVNPTSTIQALALYIADGIKKRWRHCSTESRVAAALISRLERAERGRQA